MSRRTDLHDILVTILGTKNVYFQPPANIAIKYPCIVYNRNKINTKSANDTAYNSTMGYSVALIDQNPDSGIVEKLLLLPFCRFDRHYIAENLNHDVFNIYY